jgi:hypothetical protein
MTVPEGTPLPPAFADPIEHLMPHGSISTLSGASGVGKTAFLAGMVRKWQLGLELFGLKTTMPPAIGMLACDRPWRDHQAWFDRAGCDPFPHYSLRDEAYAWELLRDSKSVPKVFGGLVDSLKLPPGSLLIVDPISLFIPGRLFDYKDVAIGLGLLDAQLKARQLTTLGVFHVAKQKGNKNDRYMRPQDRILGSSALIGYSETAFYLISPEEAERRTYEFGIISHQLKSTAYQYTRNDKGLFVPAEIFDDVQEEESALSLLPADGGALTTAQWAVEIQRAMGCSMSTAERLMRKLRRAERVVRMGKGKYRVAIPH